MNKFQRMLLSRGYCEEADEGKGGSGGSPDGDEQKEAENARQKILDAKNKEDEEKRKKEEADKKEADEAAQKEADDKKAKADEDKLSDKEATLLKEVMAKKQAYKEAQEQIQTLKDKYKAFDGLDASEVKNLIEEKKKAETEKLEAKGEWDKLKEQMVEANNAEKKTLADQLAEKDAQLKARDDTINKLTVGHAFDNSKFITDELVLTPNKARVIYGSHFEVEDGNMVAYDKPKGTEGRTQFVDGNGNPLGFDSAIKKIIDADTDRDRLLKSKIKQGAGSGTRDIDRKNEQRNKPKGKDRIASARQQASK